LRRALELNESMARHGQAVVRDGQSLVRDIEEQGALLRAAEAKSLKLEAENTKFKKEISRLIQKARAPVAQDRQPRRGQSINVRELQWALEQEGFSGTAKAVLVTFAIHSDDRGYSWPGVERIASIWRMDRDTVRRQIEVLLRKRHLRRTKRRCGATGQVKVY